MELLKKIFEPPKANPDIIEENFRNRNNWEQLLKLLWVLLIKL